MRPISIEIVGLAAAACSVGCAREFDPAQPWYIPAEADDEAEDDDGAGSNVESTSDAPANDADDGDEGSSAPPVDTAADDDGALDTMGDDGLAESSEVGDAPPSESPYQGGWDIGDCQNDIAAPTNDPGGTIDDLRFTDQFGDEIRLYDFCHKAILLIEGAFW